MKKENILVVVLAGFLLFVAVLSIKKMNRSQANTADKNNNSIKYNNNEDKSMPASLSANKKMNKPEMIVDQNKTYNVTLHTSEGNITISMDIKNTPLTANNFISLAKSNFYDGVIFHRAIKGFMIQGGDPRGDGTGGPGYQFDDEEFTGEYLRGTVAMANAGPNTNGSQFFIMHQDYALQPNYVIFGHVISGMEVVDKIAEAEVSTSFSGEMSKPINPVSIDSVSVEEK
ncbi:MAG: Peptidyl-prolyl cis-trans isomerase [Candidatus Pacebacteria bacterium GW2011_GWF2_38_9]|nr:MAG: cyclophilin-type peptidylprolyl cis-trans isomerase, peptidylprolyl isomerase [candidate division TM6 bacterium GW2011_GWF2_28_16]KKQ08662.1 MAG: Peptidyl-prolyl cis-trans isomerase [Candidatus Pacebacteria bacterium GW2011_GWF1_36_5]KKQ89008.1 MAG: Peptidyl-prolyl cis-trans isomerase [Candidatus Pacebacteria bacterium GW2011_GWF2_38_9]